MKIFNARQIREWDQYTIQSKRISSIDLMDRAAAQCVRWLEENDMLNDSFKIFCGKGNNGGDGLAMARMLSQRAVKVAVFILEFGHLGTEDFQVNLERLHQQEQSAKSGIGVEIKFIQTDQQFPTFENKDIIIDALFGSGLNRPLQGVTANLVEHINNSGCSIVAIDAPSGLPIDDSAKGNSIIKASYTLSFQVSKLSFLLPENANFIGDVHILDIGLDPDFYNSTETTYELIDKKLISTLYKPRNSFAHKGNFGHALLVAGSYGKMGAAILCAKACLRSGAGLTTCHIPKSGYEIMQTAVPEAMVMSDFNSSIVTKIEEDLSKFTCIGIGPGIGTATETRKVLQEIFEVYNKPMVIDADGLNLISSDKKLLKKIPNDSILTPHPKEFERLFGETKNDIDRLKLTEQMANKLKVVIVLKGHHTCIATPGGKLYFNNTGNAGMSKGGSGDVLTGLLTALVGQYHDPIKAAILGVYLHGLAGDIASKKYAVEAMVATDIIESLGEAFISIDHRNE